MPAPIQEIFAPLTGDERTRLEGFLRRLRNLENSGLAEIESVFQATPIPGATHLGGPAWQINVPGPPDSVVRGVITDFRLLYTDNSGVSATEALKVLSESARRRGTSAGDEAIRELRAMRKRLRERRRADPRMKILEEGDAGTSFERSPEEVVRTWFNGEYFHVDPKYAGELSPPEHVSVQMLKLAFLSAIRDFIKYWTAIGRLVQRVLDEPTL